MYVAGNSMGCMLQVKAWDVESEGSSESKEVAVTTYQYPSALLLVASSSDELQFKWQAPDDGSIELLSVAYTQVIVTLHCVGNCTYHV